MVFNLGPFIRKDTYQYFPSENPLADKGPPNLQNETISQYRTLTNAGSTLIFSYSKGRQVVKGGVLYSNTGLRERDSLGIVAATFNSPCVGGNGNPVNGFTSPTQCAAVGLLPNSAFNPVLVPYDLTRGGNDYNYLGRADIKEIALYLEDQIKAGAWLVNLGIRGDIYNGLAHATQAEPRLGLSYSLKQTNTVLRISYARTLESPFNENLVFRARVVPMKCCLLCSCARREWKARCSPVSGMNSMRGCNRHSGRTWFLAATISGNTRIMRSTSACWGILPLRSLSIGIIRRFRALRCGSMCRIITMCRHSW